MFQRIYIEISNICNLNCSFCDKNDRSPKMMTRVEFIHILDEINGFTEHIYLHVQGEPFMHPDLIFFMDECLRHKLKVHLVTNGTLLSQVNPSIFHHPALVQLSISLHALAIKENDNNFKVIKEIIKQSESLKFSLFLRIWSFKDQTLYSIVNKLLDDLMPLQLENKRTRIKKNLFIDIEDTFVWPNLNLPFQSSIGFCHGGSKMMAILSNGDISPCCLDANGIIDLGNIFNQSFKDILESNRYQNFINGFKNKQCVEELCQKCSYRLRFNK